MSILALPASSTLARKRLRKAASDVRALELTHGVAGVRLG